MSPYLKAHADDPVEWRVWGAEAFEEARASERPLMLSAGYASCHWCHVMQRESFRDEETAAFINEHLVPVKLDRELRPDVDHVYMRYVQVATGHGGWPMTVFMTPSGAPFLGGTYFPKEPPAPGMTTFPDVLRTVRSAWSEDRAAVESTAAQAVAVLDRYQAPRAERVIGRASMDRAARDIFAREDRRHGGLEGAPKFPQTPVLDFLLAYHRSTGSETALRMATSWVEAMLRGGIYDQLEGGIFRYSTDERWVVPHFEKMLYDNALLLSVLARAYAIGPTEEIRREGVRTAAFLGDRLRIGETPALASSLDAEAAGVEGGTYLWTHQELREVLSAEEYALAEEVLGVTERGDLGGGNVPIRIGGRSHEPEAVDALLDRLARLRSERPQPVVVDNVLTDWNALAARGLVEFGVAADEPAPVEEGLRLVEWLLEQSVTDGGGVLHAPLDPSASDVRLLSDAAALSSSCLRIGTLIGRDDLVDHARRLYAAAKGSFVDDGLAYMTLESGGLPVRPIRWEDSPVPSGYAMLAECALAFEDGRPAFVETLLSHLRNLMDAGPFMVGASLRVALESVDEEDVPED